MQTQSAYLNAGGVATRTSDTCIPLVVTGPVQYRFQPGGVVWTNANGSGQDWYIGPVPVPKAEVCFTNKTAGAATWILVYGSPPTQTVESMDLLPGEHWCVESEVEFVLYIQEIFPTLGDGPAITNASPIFSWEPGDGDVQTNAPVQPQPRPVPSDTGVFGGPTNDTQKAANGVVGQLQANQAQQNINDQGIKDLLREIRDKVATNQVPADSSTNIGIDASTALAGTVSNANYGYFSSGTGTVVTAFNSQKGTIGDVVLPTIPINIGDDLVVNFQPFADPNINSLAAWTRKAVLYAAKIVAIMYLFRALMMAIKDFAAAMKGNGTSGFLQAAVISIPNLFSSLGGMAVRWKLVAFALPFIFVAVSGYIIQLNAIGDMPADLGALVPANEKLNWGWQWFTYLVPVEVLLRIVITTLTAHLAMQFTILAASTITDATSKA